MAISRKLYALLVVPTLTLAACGGGGGDSDEDQIRSIIKDGANDPASICDHVTPALLKQLGGTVDACKKVAKEQDDGDKKADVSNLKVNGDSATATVTDKTGANSIKFTKSGDDWKVSG
ncbi:hypothetical protein DSM112329_04454 [Paraconexibacter sp. AEG42_29]|uniref:DUF4878 domain-containing protein n=1 Tax=Paraconexibacter sp. AEG42_29 TaxID=2997339 RepID=A0AAU7B0X6_9ACTN